MSPILVRPVREQLEHDRVIRLLQAKYKRKFEVAVNLGNSQVAPVGPGPVPWFPDLVLQSTERGRKLLGVVEVETAESVNNLEAMSQWAAFGRLKAQFHLYVPSGSIDPARRLCTDLQIPVAEIWVYTVIGMGDQLRFALAYRSPQAEARHAAASAAAAAAAAAPVAKRASVPAPKAARKAAARPAARPTKSKGAPRAVKAKPKPKSTPRPAPKATARTAQGVKAKKKTPAGRAKRT